MFENTEIELPYNLDVWDETHLKLTEVLVDNPNISYTLLQTLLSLVKHHREAMLIANMYAGAFEHSEKNSNKKTSNIFSTSLN